MRWEMVCFFWNLDMLKWMMVVLVEKRNVVSFLYSFVFSIFVGLRKKKDVRGWFFLFKLVCCSWIVFEIVLIVLFWFLIDLWSEFFMCINFLMCLEVSLVIGMFVICEMMLVMLFGVIVLCISELLLDLVVFFLVGSLCLRVGMVLNFSLEVFV